MSQAERSAEQISQVMADRAAFSVAEFSKLFGRHPSWGYRRLYRGDVRAITEFGRVLVPCSEVQRLLKTARIYNPEPSHVEAAKGELAART